MTLRELIISVGDFSELYDENVVVTCTVNGKETTLFPNSVVFENDRCIIREQEKKDISIHDFIEMLEKGIYTDYKNKNIFVEDAMKNIKEIEYIYNIDKIIHLDIREEFPDEDDS